MYIHITCPEAIIKRYKMKSIGTIIHQKKLSETMKIILFLMLVCGLVQGSERLHLFKNHHRQSAANQRTLSKLHSKILGRMCSFPTCVACSKMLHSNVTHSATKQRVCKMMLSITACCATTDKLYVGLLT